MTERSNTAAAPVPAPAPAGNETYSAATARVINQWSACMSLTNFNTANMAQAWGNMQTNNGERCASCHSTGGYGFMATGIAETKAGGPPGLFTTMATNQYYMVMYYSVDLSDTTRDATGKLMNAKMKVNEDSRSRVSLRTSPRTSSTRASTTRTTQASTLSRRSTRRRRQRWRLVTVARRSWTRRRSDSLN